jgi:hypothetical protein
VAAAAAAEAAVVAEAVEAAELALAAEAALELVAEAAQLVAQWGLLPAQLAGGLEAAALRGELAAGARSHETRR